MDWKGNLVSLLIGSALLAGIGWLAYAPWASLQELETAARMADEEALAKLIDYDKVGASLNRQLEADLDDIVAESGEDPATALNADMARMLIGPAIEQLMLPRNIATLFEGDMAPPEGSSDDEEESPDEEPAPAETGTGAESRVTTAYEGFNGFVVRIPQKTAGAPPIELFLARQNALDWKLVDVRLPRFSIISREQFAQAATPPDTGFGVADFNGDCVDARVAEFHAAQGADAEPAPEMFNAWLTECSQ